MMLKIVLKVFTFFFALFSLSLYAKESRFYAEKFDTKTPIKYLVIIYAENSTFDFYFATYPHAANPPGEPPFYPKHNTPTINGLSLSLREHNNNLVAPFRLDRSQAFTPDFTHGYTTLQEKAHAGLQDHYVQVGGDPLVMGYFDGNTVTAAWNYAQRFAMSDNFYSTTFTPSAPGHINLISGQTHGAVPENLSISGFSFTIDGTFINDLDPTFDRCSVPPTVAMTGVNVGNLLNNKNITWGWFSGGFNDCSKGHFNKAGDFVLDYRPHHEPFQYYASTANPDHLPPSSPSKIGFQDQANHQYDLEDFWIAVKNHNIPAVSFLKPPHYQDGHPGISDPLALQHFLVKTINKLQKTPEWEKMAIIIAWDDSGGCYDHVMPPIINDSQTSADALVAPGNSGSNPPFGGYQGRLAYGNRVPFLIVSPFSKQNYVDHSINDQTSILRFIEDNWKLGKIGDFSFDSLAGSLKQFFDFGHPNRKPLFLDRRTGLVKKTHSNTHSKSSK